MWRRAKRIVPLLILIAVFMTTRAAGQDGSPRITSHRIAIEGIYGPLFITVDNQEKKIANEAQTAWIIDDGRNIVYSASDGAGGYENEGQSLRIYSARTGKVKKILAEYYLIQSVENVVTSNDKSALLVVMEDGGLGASYFAIVDPLRGEVFFRRWARMLSRKGDAIVLGFYKEEDWDQIDEPATKVKPYRKERHNLKTILTRRVIKNKRDQ